MLLPSVEGQEGGKWIVIDSGMSVLHYPACLLLSTPKMKLVFLLLRISFLWWNSYIQHFMVWLVLRSVVLNNEFQN